MAAMPVAAPAVTPAPPVALGARLHRDEVRGEPADA